MTSPTESSYGSDYEIGDIVWAKIGRYPLWPSVVCMDPQTNTYIKNNENKKNLKIHVRFCSDKGKRSWVKNIECYRGKEELLKIYPNNLKCVEKREKLKNMWVKAVEEADELLKLDRVTRAITFFKTFSNLNPFPVSAKSDLIKSSVELTFSKKRSSRSSDEDHVPKIFETEKFPVNHGASTSSNHIDNSLLTRSDNRGKKNPVKKIRSTRPKLNDHKDDKSDSSESDSKKSSVQRTFSKKRSFTSSDEDHVPKIFETEKFPVNHGASTSSNYIDNSLLTRSDNRGKKNPVKKIRSTRPKLNDHKDNTSDSSESDSKKSSVQRTFSKKRSFTSSDEDLVPKIFETEKFPVNHGASTSSNYIDNSLLTRSDNRGKKNPLKKTSSTKNKLNDHKDYSSEGPYYILTEPMNVYVADNSNSLLPEQRTKDISTLEGCTESPWNPFKDGKRKPSTVKNEISKNTGRIKIKASFKNTKNGESSKNTECEASYNNAKSETSKNDTNSSTNSASEKNKELFVKNFKRACVVCKKNDYTVKCIGPCQSYFHKDCLAKSEERYFKDILTNTTKKNEDDSKYMCSLCQANKTNCFVCGLDIEDTGQKVICKLNNCRKYYHEKCLEYWPQCKWIQGSRNNIKYIECPLHVCHLCVSENPKGSCKIYSPGEKLIRCIKCPSTYHKSEYCLPAGCEVLTSSDIICGRHFESPYGKNKVYNASWCFICSSGGSLICCDLCPSSFHIKCLNQNPSEFEKGFICEECQTGRYPLYGEIVWVKMGTYRWWPAQIVFPKQVPEKVNAIKHSVGQFAVRFFGTYNYDWVNRGQVYTFHEGDGENIVVKKKKKKIDQVYTNAIIEATQAHNAYIIDKNKNDSIVAKKFIPKLPKFTQIKFNKPIASVKNMELPVITMNPCECDPFKSNPCGPGSDCINRLLMFECQPQLCPAGKKCNNQRFEKALYPAITPFLTEERGWGLKTLDNLMEGSFIIEYVGDVIDENEFRRRMMEMQGRNEQNYYFLTIDNFRMIDAGPRGNISRFMNHSCEPNCVAQKWTVNGDTRIGIFALHDILAGTELVFDYRSQSVAGVEKQPCQCGAARCSKFIGAKVEEQKRKIILIKDADKRKPSTKIKRKNPLNINVKNI